LGLVVEKVCFHRVGSNISVPCLSVRQYAFLKPMQVCLHQKVYFLGAAGKCNGVHVHPWIFSEKYLHRLAIAVITTDRWLGSRVVSVLDSGAEGPGVQILVATLSGNSLRQTVHTHCASVHQAAKLVAALFRVARVTVGGK